MKTSYRFIRFVESNPNTPYNFWICVNKKHGDELGYCDYDNEWHQWVLHGNNDEDSDVIFSADCLDDISHFLKQLNAQSVAVAAAVTR